MQLQADVYQCSEVSCFNVETDAAVFGIEEETVRFQLPVLIMKYRFLIAGKQSGNSVFLLLSSFEINLTIHFSYLLMKKDHLSVNGTIKSH